MNEPQFNGNAAWQDDDSGDADTCRICRGEATPEEPLFYPCKCSGSIKFVHQDCLMEWLSHSQKKHCELCKTPFRFTKLYSPNMPSKLPGHIFVRHLCIYTAKNIATWLRFCLVVTVWLGVLPWAMRHIWAFLFWLGDGGWFMGEIQEIASDVTGSIAGKVASLPNGTTPVGAGGITFLSNGTVAEEMVSSVVNNHNSSISFGTWLYQAFYGAMTSSYPSNLSLHGASNQHAMSDSPCGQPSLLSDVKFLKNLTRFSRINRTLITTFEGQIITIVVVICFILVFLIREWVVQQQPGINMGAGFNAEFRNRERGGNMDDAAAAAARIRDAIEQGNNVRDPEAERPAMRQRRRFLQGAEGLVPPQDPGQNNDHRGRVLVERRDLVNVDRNVVQRRPTPVRDALSEAAEIQRRLTEEAGDLENLNAAEFIAIWRRANGNSEEIVRIIDEEGLNGKLNYWKSSMETLEDLNADLQSASEKAVRGDDESETAESGASFSNHHSRVGVALAEDAGRGDAGRGDAQSPELITKPWKSTSLVDKGKQKFVEQNVDDHSSTPDSIIHQSSTNHQPDDQQAYLHTEAYNDVAFQEHSSSNLPTSNRPRSASDGPVVRTSISPLAHNNWATNEWSFSRVPKSLEQALNADSDGDKASGSNSKQTNGTQFDDAEGRKVRSHYETDADYESEKTVHDENYSEPSSAMDGDEGHHDIDESMEVENGEPVELDQERRGAPFAAVVVPMVDVGPNVLEPVNPLPLEPQGLFGGVTEWLFGDMQGGPVAPGADDEHIVQDINAEAPFVPVLQRFNQRPIREDDHDNDVDVEDEQDVEVLEAARAAGVDPNDPDGLDDAEDFEGIMELVGMRGPLAGLLQNALFSAVLISITLAFGVWIPYNFGRLVLLLFANPIATIKLPLRLMFSLAAVMQDLTLVMCGFAAYLGVTLLMLPANFVRVFTKGAGSGVLGVNIASQTLDIALSAMDRIANGLLGVVIHIPESEVPAFSAVSHEALIYIKHIISTCFQGFGSILVSLFIPPPGGFVQQSAINFVQAKELIFDFSNTAIRFLIKVPGALAKSDSWVISLNMPARSIPIDPALSCWGGADRFWAIATGYLAFCFIGAAYIRKGSPFSTSQTGRDWEATIIDILNQAGGVIKVILIISIEMLVFPLYCGLLLDLALLPLFDKATMSSRLVFTIYTPLTSIFVHWFVGTCYMFHFALFVSMCRKIMRSGVLYFIRDPDDPTFHPVRDVLERSVATQLRKITFSAMVYGALVVICLGGVVWSLAYAFPSILPVHWSSNEPVLEFPIDLLFYNFLMPLAVKVLKPADGLQTMYRWWFRQCARSLRLTWFLFDERRLDEEGHHIRHSWSEVIRGVSAKVDYSGDTGLPIPDETTDNNVRFVTDGRYVKAPGSDQVRPKENQAFQQAEENERREALLSRDEGTHARKIEMFKLVYVPPNFRARISLFIVAIWLFAAVTGVSITVIPLVFGRFIFAKATPDHIQKNDIYAFSIGVYILGSAIYSILHLKDGYRYLRTHLYMAANTPLRVFQVVKSSIIRLLRLLYTYTACAIILPILSSLIVEFYFLIPLHTYTLGTDHVIHFIQSWTLGLLYIKLISRFILWHADSRPAEALREVTRNGYLDPDVRIATRCFIFPASVIMSLVLVVPLVFATLATRYHLFGTVDQAKAVLVHRYSYPILLAIFVNIWAGYKLFGMLKGWRMRIRDEVYLIGERLHNFGDLRSRPVPFAVGGSRIET